MKLLQTIVSSHGFRCINDNGRRWDVLDDILTIAARESADLLLMPGGYLVIDIGHSGMGTGVTRAMENIALNGECAVAHTHHIASWGSQHLHFVRPDGVRESIPLQRCNWVGDEDFWAAWCIRTILSPRNDAAVAIMNWFAPKSGRRQIVVHPSKKWGLRPEVHSDKPTRCTFGSLRRCKQVWAGSRREG